jgi:hypothetical protein
MATENATPAAAPVDEAALQDMRLKLSRQIMPQVIVDRLITTHGYKIETEAEANQVVKSAMTLLDMHMAGQLNLDDAAPESTSEIIKAARDVDALAGEIRKRATADTRPFEVMLSDSEIMKQAMVLVQADPGLRA